METNRIRPFLKLLFLGLILLFTSKVKAQTSVGINTTTPNKNAVLELISPGQNQGFLVPRLKTIDRTKTSFQGTLTIAENGLLVYDSDENIFYYWNFPTWQKVSSGDISTLSQILTSGNDAGNIRIINLKDPINPQDAVTKKYVDLADAGLMIQIQIIRDSIKIVDGKLQVVRDSVKNISTILKTLRDSVKQMDTLITNRIDSIYKFGAGLPSQSGNNGKILSTDGTTAKWIVNPPDGDSDPTNELQSIKQVLLQGNNTGGIIIAGLPLPTNDSDAVNKKFVDRNIKGLRDTINLNHDSLVSIKGRIDSVITKGAGLPIQTGNNGKILSTDGTTAQWIVNPPDGDSDPTNELQSVNQVLTKGNNTGGKIIAGLPLPTNDSDAVNKKFVDRNIKGLRDTINLNHDSLVSIKGRIDSVITKGAGLPIQTGNNGKYLTTDGTKAIWNTIPVGGDMKKSDYDVNNNLKVDDADKVNGHTVLTDVPAGAVFTDNQTLSSILTTSNSAGTNKITNVVDPTLPQDAATKFYVDDQNKTQNTQIQTIRDSVKTIDTKVTNLSTVVQTTRDSIKLVDSKVEIIRDSVKLVDTKLQVIRDSVKTINTVLQTTRDSVKLVDSKLEIIRDSVKLVDTKLQVIRDSVKTINTVLQTTRDSVKLVDSKVEIIRDSVKLVDTKLQVIRDSVKTIHTVLQTTRDSVKLVDSKVEIIRDSVKLVDTKLQVIRDSVKTIHTVLQTTRDSVKLVDSKVEIIRDSVKLVDTKLQVIRDSVKTINTVLQTTRDSVKTIQNQVTKIISNPSFKLPEANIFVGDADDTARAVAVTGVLSIDKTGLTTLKNTGVVANTYGSATEVPVFTVDATGRISTVTNTIITGAAPSGAAGGDLTGSFPSPTIAANAITSAKIANGTIASVDIANNAITNTQLDQMPTQTIKGNNTGGTTNALDLTTAQVKTMLGLAGTNNGDVSLAGQNYLSIASQTITANAINLGTHVTGTLPVANGGSGATTLTGYLKGNGASSFTAATKIPWGDIDNTTTPTTLALYGIADAVNKARIVGTNAPLSGGGDLSNDLSLSISKSDATTDGYLSSVDWNKFNNKQSALTFSTGLTNTLGTITVNSSQNISTLSNLTTNGLIKTSGGTGALSIATAGTDYQAPLTLTTTGSSGAASLVGNTLNIPNYTLAGLGGISLTALSASAPLNYNNTTGVFTIDLSTYALKSGNLSQFAATTSAQLAGVISDETGSGALVFGTSPNLTTPSLGVATATSINKLTLTQPTTGATLTIADGKTLTVSDNATVSGTNTGDETNASIKTKLGVTGVVAGTNTKITYDANGLITAGSAATTDDITEGTKQYFTNARAIAAPLTSYVSGSGVITAADNILTAIQKLNGNVAASGSGTVKTVSIATANGLSGNSDGNVSDPILTLGTSVTGLLKGNGTAISAAVSGTDFLAPSYAFNLGTTSIALNRASVAQSLSGITSIDGSAAKWTTARSLAGNSVDGSANVAFANKFIVQGTADAGLSAAQFLGALGTGIVKNTTTTGVLSIAVAGTDYVAGLANPATNIGLVAVNGTATTAMRSDAAPALDVSIAPTWTGAHTWSLLGTFNAGLTAKGAAINLNVNSNFVTNIGTGTSTGAITIGNSANTVTLPVLATKGIVTNTAAGLLGTQTGTGFLKDNGAGAITYDNSTYLTSTTGVTTFAGGTTGLTPAGATSGAITLAGTLGVSNGGTGQTSFTNGQILIGNTTGNTLAKATLTGTADQIIITNGAGAITLSTPQSINTTSSPSFTGLTVSSLAAKGIVTNTAAGVLGTKQGTGFLKDDGTGTISYDNTLLTSGSSFNLGTTSIALNRASVAQSLSGITSIDGSAAKWTTARSLAGNSVDGSANVAFANKFIVQGTADAGLSAAQFLGALGTGIVKNTTTTGVLSIAVAGTDYVAGLANPATNIGLVAVNGTATTAMRSDAAPALDVSIAPTWTGAHTWSLLGTFNAGLTAKGAAINLNVNSNFVTNIGTGTSTGAITIGNSANTVTLPVLATKGIVTNTAAGLLGTQTGTGFLKDNGAGAITYDNSTYLTSTTGVATFAGGTTGLTPAGATSGTITLAGTLIAANGGTGQSAYSVGDMLYASGASALSKLADVAAGSYLRSGGVTTAPLWSTLTLPNAATQGDILFASGANAIGNLADVALGRVLVSGGVGANPAYSASPTLGVAGTTLGSLSMTGNTSGTVTIQPQAAAGTYNFNLPTTAGTTGQALVSGGGGASAMTWSTIATTSCSPGSVPYWTSATLANSYTWSNGTKLYVGSASLPTFTYDLEVNGSFKTGKIYHASDRRWKKNIQTLDSALTKVLSLRGVSYEWRKDEFPNKKFSDGTQIGVIAQEVEKVYPELVNTDAEGYKAVEYANLVAVLIEAVKAQQKLIDNQTAEITSLKSDSEKAKAEISKLSDVQKQMDELKKQMAGLQDMLQLITPTVNVKK